MEIEAMLDGLGEWIESVEALEDSLELYKSIELLEACLKLPAED